MAMFVILLPFALLSLLLSAAPPAVALFTIAALTSGLLIFDRLRGRSPKILQAATFLLTLALGCGALVVGADFTDHHARILLDAGLLIVMVASLAWRFPFTIQYARENVEADIAARPEFMRANDVMTSVWIAAMVVMLAADFTAHYVEWLPLWSGLAAAFAARNAAAWFTQWYSAKRRAAGDKARAEGLARAVGDVA